jgi:hypothetical protein
MIAQIREEKVTYQILEDIRSFTLEAMGYSM